MPQGASTFENLDFLIFSPCFFGSEIVLQFKATLQPMRRMRRPLAALVSLVSLWKLQLLSEESTCDGQTDHDQFYSINH